MELNRNSKWIKFYLKFNNYRPSNSCDYFWGSLKSILLAMMITVCAIFALSLLLSPIALLWIEFEETSDLGVFQVVGGMLWCAILLIFLIFHSINYFENRPYKNKKDSIVKIWYKDFKDKHCTLITWK